MSIVAGVDFGTLSVRVSIVDSARAGSAPASRSIRCIGGRTIRTTPPRATPITCARWPRPRASAVAEAGVDGRAIEAIALDTTGSSVIPVDERLQPLDDYYLWCDHRAWREAGEITALARERGLEAIDWCGGVYSSEWGFAKLLHWLRHNPDKRARFATALEHCDMVAATLCGITDPAAVPRSVCAMGHKWMWNAPLGGLPPEEFLTAVDPLLAGVREKLGGRYATSDQIAGHLTAGVGRTAGPARRHPDSRRRVRRALGRHRRGRAAGRRGQRGRHLHLHHGHRRRAAPDPRRLRRGAGLHPSGAHRHRSRAVGHRRHLRRHRPPRGQRGGGAVPRPGAYRAGETGLLRLTWDNGDRTVLVNPELGGVTLGWNLTHTAQDELFAAIEGTAFHTRVILERMEEYGVPVRRVINGGGIPQKNAVLNQVYANVLGKPMLVPEGDVTSLGSAIFAFLAAGAFRGHRRSAGRAVPRIRHH